MFASKRGRHLRKVLLSLVLSGLWALPLCAQVEDDGLLLEDQPNRTVVEPDWVQWNPSLPSPDTVKKLIVEEADDFSPELLKPFTGLKGLIIKDTPLPDLLFLRNFPNLTVFECQGNYLKSINGIEAATQLEEISVMHNFVRDIVPLTRLTKLHYVRLYDNDITDIGPLRDLKSITHLDLGKNLIASIEPLRGFTQLRVFSIFQDTLLTDISLIEDFTQINDLNISLLQLPRFSLSILRNMPNLENLRIQGMVKNNSELNYIKYFTGIEQLTMGLNDGVTTLDSLWRLDKLKYLDIHSNNVTNLEVVRRFHKLIKVVMYHNLVTDLSPLQGCPELRSLFAFNNPIEDYTVLYAFRQMQYLHVSLKDFTALEQQQLRHRLPATHISFF
jgi:internalin A